MNIIPGGDVMLGRLVKDAIREYGIDYPMNTIAPIMAGGDLRIINLECAITASEKIWSGPPKAFYFGAPPEAAEILSKLHIDLVNLANNHALDMDFQGLRDTLGFLQKKKIQCTGAGVNLEKALEPAVVIRNDITFGMIGFCDHQSDFAAQSNQPGIAYLNFSNENQVLEQFDKSLQTMKAQGVNWPILSLHWGPNMADEPSKKFQRIAHQVIDLGYKLLFGHSAHIFQGIEIYKDCPIIYAAGDFVDDYAVDPYFRNDHQLIYQIVLEDERLKRIFLYPVFIDYCRVKPANAKQFEFIAERMTRLCQALGTIIKPSDKNRLVIDIT